MGIFDTFKRKKAEPAKKVKEQAVKEDGAAKKDVAEEKPAGQKTEAHGRGSADFRILQKPVITEKTTMLSGSGKYVFHVHKDSNKSEITKAVENTFKVHVEAVNVVKVWGKQRRYGRTTGRTKDWKKAIVTLRPGERIEGVTATETA